MEKISLPQSWTEMRLSFHKIWNWACACRLLALHYPISYKFTGLYTRFFVWVSLTKDQQALLFCSQDGTTALAHWSACMSAHLQALLSFGVVIYCSECKALTLWVAQFVQIRVAGKLDHWRWSTHQHQDIISRRWQMILDHSLTYEAFTVLPACYRKENIMGYTWGVSGTTLM